MRVFLLVFSTLALMGANEATQKRVVSTSLCGDNYVLSMIAQKNILALSWQSGDALSAAPISMQGKLKAWDDPERLLSLTPDLVVFGAGEGRVSKPILDKAGIPHINIEWGEDFASIRNNQAALAKASSIKKQKINVAQRLPRHLPTKHLPTILYLSSSGATAGPGTYVNAAIKRAGGTNIITKAGWHTPDPETLVALKPDLIITSFFKDGYVSVNESSLRNKALQGKIKSTPTVNIPGKLWPCAGPGLYDASNLIAEAIAELDK